MWWLILIVMVLEVKTKNIGTSTHFEKCTNIGLCYSFGNISIWKIQNIYYVYVLFHKFKIEKILPQRTKSEQDGAYGIEAVNVISDGLEKNRKYLSSYIKCFFRLFPIISISQKIFSFFFLTLEKIGIDEKVICYHNISN